MMEFMYTEQDLKRAKKRRIKYESKFRTYKTAENVLIVLMFIVPVIIYFYIRHQGNILTPGFYTVNVYTKEKIPVSPWVFAIPSGFLIGVAAFLVRLLIERLANHWIGDRFCEKLFVENGRLHHTYRTSHAGGAFTWTPGNDVLEEVITLDSIHGLKIDSKAGRVEFKGTSCNMVYTDWERRVKRQAPLIVNDFEFITYDFYQPSLIDYLIQLGIPYREGPMEYKSLEIVRKAK